ncbi:hypothetical protein SAMN05444277_102253 [Parafilimonas terrae]|uniref:Uncharacterized protein n=1 Tax=Parafilimonas terrae TaxID=1465490 RepID=A0A1I5TQM0_9BACT|nr:hypothetical protein [Parafilimonas terrae]SFP85350.1 hypothetical protein SAMN05444277_102253 [Parafilimonas terrae]
MLAAKGIMKARQRAATGVNQGVIWKYTGAINPAAPAISETPINFIKRAGSPSTPVWPFATNIRSGNIDLQIPE